MNTSPSEKLLNGHVNLQNGKIIILVNFLMQSASIKNLGSNPGTKARSPTHG